MDKVKSMFAANSTTKYEISEWLKEDDKLMSYVKKKNLEKVQSMVKKGAVVTKIDPALLHSCLAQACRDGDITIVKSLTQATNIDIDARDSSGRTALHHAIICGRREVAQYLIWIGASTKLVDYDRNSLMHHAVICGHFDCVALLAEQHAEVDYPDKTGQTPLILSCIKGQATIARILLQNKANINHKEMHGRTPLITASMYGHDALCSYLLDNGADKNAMDNKGHNSLWHAIDKERSSVRKILEETKDISIISASQNMNHQTLESSRNSTTSLPANFHETFLHEIEPAPDSELYENIDEYINKEQISVNSNSQHLKADELQKADIQGMKKNKVSTIELIKSDENAINDYDDEEVKDVYACEIPNILDDGKASVIYSKVHSSTSTDKCPNCEMLEKHIVDIKNEKINLEKNIEIIAICENCENHRAELISNTNDKQLNQHLSKLQIEVKKMHEKAISEKSACLDHVNDLLLISAALNDIHQINADEFSNDDKILNPQKQKSNLEDLIKVLQVENNQLKLMIIESEKNIRMLKLNDNDELAKKYKYLKSQIDFTDPSDLISYVTDSLEEISRLTVENKNLESQIKCNLKDYNDEFEEINRQMVLMSKKLNNFDEVAKENNALKYEVNQLRDKINFYPLKPGSEVKVKSIQRSTSVDGLKLLGVAITEKDIFSTNFEQIKKLFLMNKNYNEEKSIITNEYQSKTNEFDEIRLKSDSKRKELQIEHLQRQCENYGRLSTNYDIMNIEYNNIVSFNGKLKAQNNLLKQQINTLIDEAKANLINKDEVKIYTNKNEEIQPKNNFYSYENFKLGKIATERDILHENMNIFKKLLIHNNIIIGETDKSMKETADEQIDLIKDIEQNILRISEQTDRLKDYSKLTAQNHVLNKEIAYFRLLFAQIEKSLYDLQLSSDIDSVKLKFYDYAEQDSGMKEVIHPISEVSVSAEKPLNPEDIDNIYKNNVNIYEELLQENKIHVLKIKFLEKKLNDYEKENSFLKKQIPFENKSYTRMVSEKDLDSTKIEDNLNSSKLVLPAFFNLLANKLAMKKEPTDVENSSLEIKEIDNKFNKSSKDDFHQANPKSKNDEIKTVENITENDDIKMNVPISTNENIIEEFIIPVIIKRNSSNFKSKFREKDFTDLNDTKMEENNSIKDTYSEKSNDQNLNIIFKDNLEPEKEPSMIIGILLKENKELTLQIKKLQDILSVKENINEGEVSNQTKNNNIDNKFNDYSEILTENGILKSENNIMQNLLKNISMAFSTNGDYSQNANNKLDQKINEDLTINKKLNDQIIVLEKKYRDYGLLITEKEKLEIENINLKELLKNKLNVIDDIKANKDDDFKTNKDWIYLQEQNSILEKCLNETNKANDTYKKELENYGVLITENHLLKKENEDLKRVNLNFNTLDYKDDINSVHNNKVSNSEKSHKIDSNDLIVELLIKEEKINELEKQLKDMGIIIVERDIFKSELEKLQLILKSKSLNDDKTALSVKESYLNEKVTNTLDNDITKELQRVNDQNLKLNDQLFDYGRVILERDLILKELNHLKLISSDNKIDVKKDDILEKVKPNDNLLNQISMELEEKESEIAKLKNSLENLGKLSIENEILNTEIKRLQNLVKANENLLIYNDNDMDDVLEELVKPTKISTVETYQPLKIVDDSNENNDQLRRIDIEKQLKDYGLIITERDLLKHEVILLRNIVSDPKEKKSNDIEALDKSILLLNKQLKDMEYVITLKNSRIEELNNKLNNYGSIISERDLLIKENEHFKSIVKLDKVQYKKDEDDLLHSMKLLRVNFEDISGQVLIKDNKLKKLENELNNYSLVLTENDLLKKEINNCNEIINKNKDLAVINEEKNNEYGRLSSKNKDVAKELNELLDMRDKRIIILEENLKDFGNVAAELDIVKQENEVLKKNNNFSDMILEEKNSDKIKEYEKLTKNYNKNIEDLNVLLNDENEKIIILKAQLKDFGNMSVELDLIKKENEALKKINDQSFKNPNINNNILLMKDHSINSKDEIEELKNKIILKNIKISDLEKQLDNFGIIITENNLLQKENTNMLALGKFNDNNGLVNKNKFNELRIQKENDVETKELISNFKIFDDELALKARRIEVVENQLKEYGLIITERDILRNEMNNFSNIFNSKYKSKMGEKNILKDDSPHIEMLNKEQLDTIENNKEEILKLKQNLAEYGKLETEIDLLKRENEYLHKYRTTTNNINNDGQKNPEDPLKIFLFEKISEQERLILDKEVFIKSILSEKENLNSENKNFVEEISALRGLISLKDTQLENCQIDKELLFNKNQELNMLIQKNLQIEFYLDKIKKTEEEIEMLNRKLNDCNEELVKSNYRINKHKIENDKLLLKSIENETECDILKAKLKNDEDYIMKINLENEKLNEQNKNYDKLIDEFKLKEKNNESKIDLLNSELVIRNKNIELLKKECYDIKKQMEYLAKEDRTPENLDHIESEKGIKVVNNDFELKSTQIDKSVLLITTNEELLPKNKLTESENYDEMKKAHQRLLNIISDLNQQIDAQDDLIADKEQQLFKFKSIVLEYDNHMANCNDIKKQIPYKSDDNNFVIPSRENNVKAINKKESVTQHLNKNNEELKLQDDINLFDSTFITVDHQKQDIENIKPKKKKVPTATLR